MHLCGLLTTENLISLYGTIQALKWTQVFVRSEWSRNQQPEQMDISQTIWTRPAGSLLAGSMPTSQFTFSVIEIPVDTSKWPIHQLHCSTGNYRVHFHLNKCQYWQDMHHLLFRLPLEGSCSFLVFDLNLQIMRVRRCAFLSSMQIWHLICMLLFPVTDDHLVH